MMTSRCPNIFTQALEGLKTRTFDSNIPTTDEVDQNENDNLDQNLVEEEPSEEIVPQVQERHSPQAISPEIVTRIDYQQLETDHYDFRPPTVRFGTEEEIILPPHPPPAMKAG